MQPREVVPLVSLVPLPERCPLARTAFLLALKGSAAALPWKQGRDDADRCTVAPLMEGMTHHTWPLPRQRLHGCTVVRGDNHAPLPAGPAGE
jgi:hypothetical protein